MNRMTTTFGGSAPFRQCTLEQRLHETRYLALTRNRACRLWDNVVINCLKMERDWSLCPGNVEVISPFQVPRAQWRYRRMSTCSIPF